MLYIEGAGQWKSIREITSQAGPAILHLDYKVSWDQQIRLAQTSTEIIYLTHATHPALLQGVINKGISLPALFRVAIVIKEPSLDLK